MWCGGEVASEPCVHLSGCLLLMHCEAFKLGFRGDLLTLATRVKTLDLVLSDVDEDTVKQHIAKFKVAGALVPCMCEEVSVSVSALDPGC